MAPRTANSRPATTPTANGPPPRARVTAIIVRPSRKVMAPTTRVEARYARSTEASLRPGSERFGGLQHLRQRFGGGLLRLGGGDHPAGGGPQPRSQGGAGPGTPPPPAAGASPDQRAGPYFAGPLPPAAAPLSRAGPLEG